MPTTKPSPGFTLIEIIIVLAVIAILLTMALPNTSNQVTQLQVKESLGLIEGFQKKIADAYLLSGKFPEDNNAANMPEAEKIMGNYISSVTVIDGALHINMGNKAHKLILNKRLSVRPIYVELSPTSPISWVCGYDEVPNSMQVSGGNLSTIERSQLPLICR